MTPVFVVFGVAVIGFITVVILWNRLLDNSKLETKRFAMLSGLTAVFVVEVRLFYSVDYLTTLGSDARDGTDEVVFPALLRALQYVRIPRRDSSVPVRSGTGKLLCDKADGVGDREDSGVCDRPIELGQLGGVAARNAFPERLAAAGDVRDGAAFWRFVAVP